MQELSILNYLNIHASHESKTPTLQATYIEYFVRELSNQMHESNNLPNHEKHVDDDVADNAPPATLGQWVS